MDCEKRGWKRELHPLGGFAVEKKTLDTGKTGKLDFLKKRQRGGKWADGRGVERRVPYCSRRMDGKGVQEG